MQKTQKTASHNNCQGLDFVGILDNLFTQRCGKPTCQSSDIHWASGLLQQQLNTNLQQSQPTQFVYLVCLRQKICCIRCLICRLHCQQLKSSCSLWIFKISQKIWRIVTHTTATAPWPSMPTCPQIFCCLEAPFCTMSQDWPQDFRPRCQRTHFDLSTFTDWLNPKHGLWRCHLALASSLGEMQNRRTLKYVSFNEYE